MGTQEESNGSALFRQSGGKGFDEDTEATVGHLEILANVDIEKVPFH